MRCAGCHLPLDEVLGTPLEECAPCPQCGSRNRLSEKTVAATVPMSASLTKTVGKTLTAPVTVSPSLTASVIAATAAAAYALLTILVHPAKSEPGYHLPHHHHDIVGGAIVFGLPAPRSSPPSPQRLPP